MPQKPLSHYTNELAGVVEERRLKGFPLHSPPHPYRDAHEYFITSATYLHQPILNSVNRLQEFESLVLETMRQAQIETAAWVFLPNHYHLLIAADSLDLVSHLIKRVHGSTAREWNIEDSATGNRRVWYRFSDRVIRDENHRYRVMNYIHYNPVKHGLVDLAVDWPWSSIHSYFETNGREWLVEMWKKHPPGQIGKDWDD